MRSPLQGSNSLDSAMVHWLQGFEIAVVIPCFRVEDQIESVLTSIPIYVSRVIVVDDASPDRTQFIVRKIAAEDKRIVIVQHSANQGVGAAMVTGFRKALELGAQVIAKMDGDGQMSADDLPALLLPLIRGEADYAKGNRFRDFRALRRMPSVRLLGNMVLSFLVKAATGYWSCFDPSNGFVAIRGDVLSQLQLDKIHRSYFFETSMLSQLYLLRALVRDVPIQTRYGSERSNLSISKILFEFPPRLLAAFTKRMVLCNFIYDFNMVSLEIVFGLPMVLAGLIYGGVSWLHYLRLGVGAPTGTVVIPTMLIILGFQLLLSAVGGDLQTVPTRPICKGPIIRQATRNRPSRQLRVDGKKPSISSSHQQR